MKIIRTEDGTFTRIITLEIDEVTVEKINKDLEDALVNGAKYIPLTVEEVWDIMLHYFEAPRHNEEYFVELKFYSGNMKLGDFVRFTINDIFEELPGETDEQTEVWYDEFQQ